MGWGLNGYSRLRRGARGPSPGFADSGVEEPERGTSNVVCGAAYDVAQGAVASETGGSLMRMGRGGHGE